MVIKKLLFLSLVSLTLGACQYQQNNDNRQSSSSDTSQEQVDPNQNQEKSPQTSEEPSPQIPTELSGEDVAFVYEDIVGKEFTFSSGVGAWGTTMTFGQDGHFTGVYRDSNGQETYQADFSGQFIITGKEDAQTYQMALVNLKVTSPSGTKKGMPENEDIIINYISAPYGLEESQNFELYLPGKSVAGLDEDFMSWIDGSQNMTRFDRYTIHNLDKGYGFVEEIK